VKLVKLIKCRNFFALCFFVITSFLYSCEVKVLPEKPKGGEGLFIKIEKISEQSKITIVWEENKYFPYISGDKREIFLPVSIEDKGTKQLVVEEKLVNEVKKINIIIEIQEREKKIYYLTEKSIEMRKKQPSIKEQQNLVLSALNNKDEKKYWNKEFIFPVEGEVTNEFGVERKGKNYFSYHKGIDFSTPLGIPVKAINDGKIILSEKNFNIYGNLIVLDHGQGVVSCYFHLDKLFKKVGEIVSCGEIIGETGNTGWSSQPHLHLGIYLQGKPVDPIWFINFSKELIREEN